MTRRKRSPIWVRLCILLLALAAAGFGIERMRRGRALPDLPTAAARRGEFLVLARTRGELIARRSIGLHAPRDVPDLQIVLLAPPGSEVQPGQVVVRFDPSRAQQQLRERGASLKQAQGSLDQALAQAKNTAEQDKLDLAQARYDVERARLEASKQAIVSAIQGAESRIDLGLAEEKLKVEQATVELHRKSDEAKVASLTRLRDQEQTEIDITRAQLEKMEVHSPIKGVVSFLSNYSQGWMNAQPFKVGDHVWPGAAIAEIPELDTLEMESRVDEVDRGAIGPGSTVLVHVDAYPETTFQAKLMMISPLTEESITDWPPTRSFKAYAKIDKPDPRLRPGMNAGADFVVTRIPDAISIPAKALFMHDGKPAVYVRTPKGFQPRELTVVARNPEEVAVSGIAAGAQVALQEPAKDGQRP
jgi:HlyD family secretion protein